MREKMLKQIYHIMKQLDRIRSSRKQTYRGRALTYEYKTAANRGYHQLYQLWYKVFVS